ncbi:MAG TPA: leucyl/phenylalanyl-tRNA--protein transferase [Lacipirellulaceae bacterium]|nr:leucyl/phenylalanyl-tRNA--protein transferase [Lacipirellulaceae bacterium]
MAREPNSFDELFVPLDITAQAISADIGLPPLRFFPPPTSTTPEGLLCIGGGLSPEWLLDAYRHGIFPWPMWEDEPIAWWSPDPRAIIELDRLHVSRRLKRTIRSGRFRVTCDQDFAGVIHGCARSGDRRGNTWLTPAMIAAYCHLHSLGYAHSVEVWLDAPPSIGGNQYLSPPLALGEGRSEGVLVDSAQSALTPNPSPKGRGEMGAEGRGKLGANERGELGANGRGELVGGTYGVAIGGLFAAESMFHRVRDASKVALAYLVAHLRARGYQLLDVQQWTPHTGRLGAVEIPRIEYLRRLAVALKANVRFGDRLEGAV